MTSKKPILAKFMPVTDPKPVAEPVLCLFPLEKEACNYSPAERWSLH
jgi:hypothetical protein